MRKILSTGGRASSTCSRKGNAHLVGVWVFPVVLKQMTHGPLIAPVGSSVTLTVQVQGILIKSTIVHNTKGHIHLKGDKDEVKTE